MDILIGMILFALFCWVLFKIPYVRSTIKSYNDAFQAKRLEKHTKSNIINNPAIKKRTQELFNSMEGVINEIGGPILDIGCGTGANLSFYPANAKLWTIDLNDFFHSYLKENMKTSKATLERHEVGNAEDMSELFEDETFSCVVCTKLLCCVDNEKTLREIMRVLKPGGRFYFMEHIIEEPWTFTRIFQILFSPIWQNLIFSCHIDRQTDEVLKKFGFDNFSMEIWDRPLPTKYFFARRTCIGHGDKSK